jgi:hypothetical protein
MWDIKPPIGLKKRGRGFRSTAIKPTVRDVTAIAGLEKVADNLERRIELYRCGLG